MSSVQSMKSTPLASPTSGTGTCGPGGGRRGGGSGAPFPVLEPCTATGGRLDGPTAHEHSSSPNAARAAASAAGLWGRPADRRTPVSLGHLGAKYAAPYRLQGDR